MTEFHRLPSKHDEKHSQEWEMLNAEAEIRAKKEPTAPMPDLDHLTSDDFQHVYEPASDTFLLIDAIQYELRSGLFRDRLEPVIALELGCGTAVPSVFLRRHWQDVKYFRPTLLSFATDVNPRALEVAQMTAKISDPDPHFFEFVRCDLASSLLDGLHRRVSILLFNPPYVSTPDEEVGGVDIEASWAGGENGRRVVDRAISQIEHVLEKPSGVAYLVTVDDNNPFELAQRFQQLGLKMRPLLRRKAFNERLTIQKVEWIS
jgi:release factor glutamine methyltransferase